MDKIKLRIGEKFLVTIKRLGINGEGIGFYKHKIVFVKKALPNEVVEVELIKVYPNYLQAKLKKIKKKSTQRVVPVDNYDVGGIELEHLAYDAQLEFKADIIKQALGKYKPKGYKDFKILKTLGMKNPYKYRNKAQFQVRKDKYGKVIAGLYRENSHQLVDLKSFKTQTDLTMKVIRDVCNLLDKWKIPIYNEKKNNGVIKTLVVRESFALKKIQLVFVTFTKKIPSINSLISDLTTMHPEIISIMQNINSKKTSLIWGEVTHNLYGENYLKEKIGDVEFKLSARAFFQLNPIQTKVLYDEVKKALDLKEDEILVDAYCGVGTIGLYIAKNAKQILGMDIIKDAILDARENARLSGQKNTRYEVGDAGEIFKKWTREKIIPNAMVVDPPRTGLDDNLISTILKYQPQKLVYVSCNPSTLARDLVKLVQKYKVVYIQSIDMFPQTARCEAVVKLERNS